MTKLNNSNFSDFNNRYLIKSKIMGKNLHKLYSNVSEVLYFNSVGITNQDKCYSWLKYSPSEAMEIYQKYSKLYPYVWRECSRICNASYKRSKRLKDRINNMILSGNCIFATFTWSDNTLNNTSDKTRKKYVERFLQSLNASDYIANIDYGSINDREHYHSVIRINKIPTRKLEWWYNNYGRIEPEPVKKSETKIDKKTGEIIFLSSERLAKYVSKLTNHAIKETTKQNRIIYSRKTK